MTARTNKLLLEARSLAIQAEWIWKKKRNKRLLDDDALEVWLGKVAKLKIRTISAAHRLPLPEIAALMAVVSEVEGISGTYAEREWAYLGSQRPRSDKW